MKGWRHREGTRVRHVNDLDSGEEWRCFQAGIPGPGIWKCTGKLEKDRKYLMHIYTQGVDMMLAIVQAWVRSLKLADISQSVTQRCVHCQANKPHNAVQIDGYVQEYC